jgi:hypothetical protein
VTAVVSRSKVGPCSAYRSRNTASASLGEPTHLAAAPTGTLTLDVRAIVIVLFRAGTVSHGMKRSVLSNHYRFPGLGYWAGRRADRLGRQ